MVLQGYSYLGRDDGLLMNGNNQHEGGVRGNGTGSDGDTPVDLGLVNQVRQIFAAQNWPIAEEDSFNDEGPFERTMKMLTQLDKQEANLVLNLLARFVRIEHAQYLAEMKKLVIDLVKNVAPQRVVIVPIRSLKDSKKKISNSGDMMGIVARTAFAGSPVPVKSYSDLEATEIRTVVGKPGCYVLGVDDFIGTGKTATSFIDHYAGMFPGQLPRLKLASLVCLERGAQAIQDRGCDLYCLHRLGRGISDYAAWSSSDKGRNVGTMVKIEDRIGVQTEYRMGYGASEGLVKMMRTPNNTFPVFWMTKRYNRAPWPATFPR